MRITKPKLRLIARPQIDGDAMYDYLNEVGGTSWAERCLAGYGGDIESTDAEALVEFAGRLCYRSWEAGLNPNVTKVRENSADYLRNVLLSGHGSVFEHAQFSFVASNVSRVFTHELVRHRVGTAYSQESLRYVRLDDIPFWFPDWFKEYSYGGDTGGPNKDTDLYDDALRLLREMEEFQGKMAKHFGLDDEGVNFSEKKAKTSFMRRFAPIGLSTTIQFSMNLRTIRHFIEMRTSEHAEEEIRIIADALGRLMMEECPLIFGDYSRTPDDADNTGNEPAEWVPETRKV